jgi:drug/metabolite transporter (DMT)-like permease
MNAQKSGYIFAILAFVVFASQDAISKHLATYYHPIAITLVRYYAFAGFAVLIASRAPGGLRAAVRTRHPVLQVLRGLLLVSQIAIAMRAFHDAGLVQTQAIFASSPLLVAILAVPILGEKVGWRRVLAILVGLCGVLIILKPSGAGFDESLILPLFNAVQMAIYAVITRICSRDEQASTNFFYLGIVGWLAISLAGPFYWQPIARVDWIWMAIICMTGVVSHYLLILAYNRLDAIQIQPISYFQLVWASILGVVIFNESLHWNVVLGSLIVVGAGLFTIWREAVRQRQSRPRQS